MSSLLFGNGTNIVHWKPSSDTRSTFDILSTCIITMLLCVWTAVHLNVSPPGSVWTSRLRKVGWMILALLAPELVAYTAWYQRRQALGIMRVVNHTFVLSNPSSFLRKAIKGIKRAISSLRKALSSHNQGPVRQLTLEAQRYPLPQDRHPWTVTHGFYANMGGIAFEISKNIAETKKFLPSHSKEVWFINPIGIRLLLEHAEHRDILPNLSKEEIESKSKANGLAKTVVCVQALWFIAQCITRLAQRIPISLLELNTFGHAVCMLFIYFLWWEKPFEVDYPTTIIEGQILWDLRALLSMQCDESRIAKSYVQDLKACAKSDPKWQAAVPERRHRYYLFKQMKVEYESVVTSVEDDDLRVLISGEDRKTAKKKEAGGIKDNETNSVTLAPGEYLAGTCSKVPTFREFLKRFRWLGVGDYNGPHPFLPKIRLSSRDIIRWKMAWHAIQAFTEDSWRYPNISAHNLIKSRCKDWPDIENILNEFSVALGFSAAAFIYGGLHALAWSAHFESPTEQLLWRISACVVMGGVPVMCVLEKAADYQLKASDYQFSLLDYIIIIIVVGPLPVVLPAYIIARVYLVVECFINISHLPAGVYDVPCWAAYFPHIS